MVKLAKLGRVNQSINHSSNSFINQSNQSVWIWISRIKIQKEVYHIISYHGHRIAEDKQDIRSIDPFTLLTKPRLIERAPPLPRPLLSPVNLISRILQQHAQEKHSADAAKAEYPDHKADAETGMGEQSVRHSQSYPNKTTGGSLDRRVAMMWDSVDC